MVGPPPISYWNDTIQVCTSFPAKVNSAGVWEDTPSTILSYSLPLLELQLVLIFLVSQIVHVIFKPIGLTFFASQMFSGLMLGPAMLGKMEGIHYIFFSSDHLDVETIDTVSLFGFSMFLFLMGVKMDVNMAFTASRRAILIGIISLLAPLVFGLAVYDAFKYPHQSKTVSLERKMGITIESLTSCSVIAWLLSELKILNSELGRMALSSAVVGDISTLILVYFNASMTRWSISPKFAMVHVAIMIIFLFLIFSVFRSLMFRIIRGTPDGKPVKEVYIVIIVMVALACGLFTSKFSHSPLVGPFLVGLAVPEGPPIGSALVEKFESFVNGIFLVLYVTTSAMAIQPEKLFEDLTNFKFCVLSIVISFFAKSISCFIASFWDMMPFKDSLAFALIMSSKGVVELSYFCTFRDIEFMSKATFTIFSLGILLNSIIIPILVKFLYDPDARRYATYQKRNIQHLHGNAELRILACIHIPEHVPALIDLLDITCPTKESPNFVVALHLIELTGRETPVFIAHTKQENVVGNSFEHILAFNKYEGENGGLVTINSFTAISPPKFMHDDVCTLALNKQTSFILLPFHRKWSIDGSIEVENSMIRNLKCCILDRAPCSVGILISRGILDRKKKSLKISTSSSFSIGMLFLGGKDDQEALTLAKRMANDPRVKLTVIHMICDEYHEDFMNWDMMLDTEVLKDTKCGGFSNGGNVMYVEEVSNSGPEAARIVQSIADDYDLFIVGRRHGVHSVQTTGLSAWSDLPELGVLGDLLASTDLNTRASVLVVQQQHLD